MPPDVKGVVHLCDAPTECKCTMVNRPDSFVWYHLLPSSKQISRVIAREFVSVVKGEEWPCDVLGLELQRWDQERF